MWILYAVIFIVAFALVYFLTGIGFEVLEGILPPNVLFAVLIGVGTLVAYSLMRDAVKNGVLQALRERDKEK